jgi:hypothetical protein
MIFHLCLLALDYISRIVMTCKKLGGFSGHMKKRYKETMLMLVVASDRYFRTGLCV